MAKIYSVGQINKYIKNMFQSDFLLSKVTVQGEISNCKYHSSGHIYFTLKDEDGTIQAVMFSGNRETGLKVRLSDGMQVVVQGSITIYERDGKYQLYAKKIEQAGLGARYEQFMALKQRLEEMGMFDSMFKKRIPKYIKTLGVVTASTGAAIRDIINVATRRNPYIQIVLYPALVQGDGAVDSICNGIKALDKYGVDIIIAGRGGGSIEDLWAFNDEAVARCIFDCNTPVISAVGHEIDFTIADFVADLRAATPSAAAELAVCDMAQIFCQLDDLEYNIHYLMQQKTDEYAALLKRYRMQLNYLSPENVLNNHMKHLDDLRDALDRNMNNRMSEFNNRLSLYCSKLEALSPLARLSSGYSYIVDKDGNSVTQISDVTRDDVLKIYVKDGNINAGVIDIEKRN